MRVLIIREPDHIVCQVQTSKYLLEARVTQEDIVYSVNFRKKKLPKTKSANLVRRAAEEVKKVIDKNGMYGENMIFDLFNIERRLNES